jgi:hypothetical protein
MHINTLCCKAPASILSFSMHSLGSAFWSCSNVPALIATTSLLSAATTYILMRRLCCSTARNGNSCKRAASSPSPMHSPLLKDDPLPPLPAEETNTDNLSYLCSSCGVQKDGYPRESKLPKTNGPVKLVILVRQDLNMVHSHHRPLSASLRFCRGKERLQLSVAIRFWRHSRPRRLASRKFCVAGNAKDSPKSH